MAGGYPTSLQITGNADKITAADDDSGSVHVGTTLRRRSLPRAPVRGRNEVAARREHI
jgi:hypothetical protein